MILILSLYQINILVRFVPLTSDRIGHFATNSLIYYYEKKSIKKKYKIIDIVFVQKKICNLYLEKLIRNKIKIYNNLISYPIYLITKTVSSKIIFFQNFIYDNYPLKIRDENLRIYKNSIFHKFSKKEKERGFFELKKFFGVNSNQKFVCLIIRDEKYLSKNFKNTKINKNTFRNINPEKFYKTAQYLNRNGYFVFRMGKEAGKKFAISKNNKMIIDYPFSKNKSDFLDLFIIANSEFLISTGCGLDEIGVIFKKPIALIEPSIAYYRNYHSKILHIFRRYRKISNKQILKTSEILDKNLDIILGTKHLNDNNIFLEEPSENEILNLTKEIIYFVKNKFVIKNKKIKLEQKKFQKFYKERFFSKSYVKKKSFQIKNKWLISKQFHSIVSPDYLKRNKWLSN